MNTLNASTNVHARLTALTASIAALLGLSLAPPALATTRIVMSCSDDINDSGNLRNTIATASTGDTIDLSGLSCPNSKITLAAGGQHIAIGQKDLTIKGPAADQLTIDGSQLETYYKNYSNVFYHTGTGLLKVKYLTVSGGHQSHKILDSLGGCIYSAGSVVVSGSVITQCSAYSKETNAKGGAIFAKGDVKAYYSRITGNMVTTGGGSATGGGISAVGDVYMLGSEVGSNQASSPVAVFGGGIFTSNGLTVHASTITGNSAMSTGSGLVRGGGAEANGDIAAAYSTISDNAVSSSTGAAGGGALNLFGSATIANSTVSGNSSNGGYGAINAFSATPGTKTFLMRNSTISGNHAAWTAGGVYVNSGTIKLYNSTIAFNTSGIGSPGLVISANKGAIAATLQSNLLTDNSSFGVESDLDIVSSAQVTFNVGPANNLVRVANAGSAQLPSDTIATSCALLGPLRDNGGPTKTHALRSTSPAIDAGNNILIDPDTNQPYAFDQRGSATVNVTFDYLRASGPQADIGAHEVQQLDVVFDAGFDGCLPLTM